MHSGRKGGKMDYQFMGPYTIMSVDAKKSRYTLMTEEGKVLAQQVNASNLKLYNNPQEEFPPPGPYRRTSQLQNNHVNPKRDPLQCLPLLKNPLQLLLKDQHQTQHPPHHKKRLLLKPQSAQKANVKQLPHQNPSASRRSHLLHPQKFPPRKPTGSK